MFKHIKRANRGKRKRKREKERERERGEREREEREREREGGYPRSEVFCLKFNFSRS